MSRYLLALLPLLGLALLAVACGDGGSGDPTATPQPSGGATATIELTETSGEQLSPTAADEEDGPNDQTPDADSTAPASTSTPALAGTPLASPVDLDVDIVTEQVECGFDPTSSVADCADRGTYTIDPPLLGGYTSCSLSIIQDQPALLICTGEGNVPPIYYPLQ